MKILVLVKDYPTADQVGAMFVHTRCKQYVQQGVNVCVVSASNEENYVYDGIPVYTSNYYTENLRSEHFDLLVSHAPHVDFDVPFLERFSSDFDHIVFVFHGQEVLFKRFVYSAPYPYMRKKFLNTLREDYYDICKLRKIRSFFRNIKVKSEFVFVSNWMHDEFVRWIGYEPKKEAKSHVIYNCIGKEFETNSYDCNTVKQYDFIAIRSNFDGSKYCVDIICELALLYPQYTFLLIGRGNYFKHNIKPKNVTVEYALLNHEQVIDKCNSATCALMFTRTDAQGVMACEIATFGMPVITSDIKVMREVFEGFENVILLPNNAKKIDLETVYSEIKQHTNPSKNEKYFEKNTSLKELELFGRIINE